MTAYRIFPSTNGPGTGTADATTYTLGVEFYITASARLAGYFFWVASDQDTAAKPFQLFTVDSGGLNGSPVADSDVTSGVLTAGQWNYVPLAAPVDLVINQRYRAAVLVAGAASPKYSSTANFWSSGGGSSDVVNGKLTAPTRANAEGLLQGSFRVTGIMEFPNSEFNATNYWVDVLVEDLPAGGSTLRFRSSAYPTLYRLRGSRHAR